MKRKTILSFITGLFLLGGLSSCMDLDETVYDKLPADDFGQSTAELNALIGNSHNTMKKFWTEYMHLSECSGSMAVTPTRRGGDWYDGGQYREIYMHTWTSQTQELKAHGKRPQKRLVLVTRLSVNCRTQRSLPKRRRLKTWQTCVVSVLSGSM